MKKKIKKRGRKRGSKFPKNKVCPWLVEIVLKCCKCKRKIIITTQKDNLDTIYTKAVKKAWTCGLCK